MNVTRLLLCFTLAFFLHALLSAQAGLPEKHQLTFRKKANLKSRLLLGASPDIPNVPDYLGGLSQEDNPAVSPRAGAAFSVPMGSSYNPYSVILEANNPLSYHPDLNTLIFAHRQNFPFPGGSGIISFDVSTDGGASWDTITKQVTPSLQTADGIAINGNRYPNGTIYNPAGNTDPANAWFVGTGASLWNDPDFGSGWGWEWVASSRLDGSQVDEAYYSISDTNIYLSGGMVYHPDGSLWYANYRREENFAHQLFNPMLVGKLTFNSSTNSFGRSLQELPLDYSSGVDSLAVNPRIEFSPDGQTGYFVVTGIDADDDEIYPSFKPIIWKTTDGGENWVKQPRVHYQEMDSLIAYSVPIDGDGDGAADPVDSESPRVPFMSQFDITVDATGQLHIFASMFSASDTATTAQDFGFVWIDVGTAELFHFITDGDSWQHYRVGDWYNETQPIGNEEVDERTQASRTPDGQYVFFTYCKTWYEEIEAGNTNNAPDIYGYAYRLSDGYIVDPKNYGLEPGTDFLDFQFTDVAASGYFHMLSPVAISDGENWDYELPIVYGIPRDLNSDLQPIDYYFLRSAGFDDEEFHERGVMVSTQQLSAFQSFAVFPNPAGEQVNIEFSFDKPTAYRLSIHNFLGQHLRTIQQATAAAGPQLARADISGWNAGVYLIKIEAEGRIDTRRLVIR